MAGNAPIPSVPRPVDEDRSTLASIAFWMQIVLITLGLASIVAGALLALWFLDTNFAPSFP